MSQIGPDYTYNTDATIAAGTNRKLIVLAKKNTVLAATVAKFLGIGDSVPGLNLSGALDDLDAYTRNVIQTQFSQELAIARKEGSGFANATIEAQGLTAGISGSIQGATATAVTAIGSVGNNFDQLLTNTARSINDAMKPVSKELGSTLGTLTGIARDPLGSLTQLPQALLSVVEKISPEFAADLERTFKSQKMRGLANLPNQILGSVRSLLTAADAILSLPLVLISDLYNGLMAIMQEISNLVDKAISSIMDFIFGPGGLLDSILPIAEILAFLEAISELASEIQGISTIFLGANPIAGFALNVQTYANQLNGALSNPANLLAAYLPEQVSQGLYILRNPQQLVNSILPPELSQQFAKLSQITGFGFNGNMGFGFQSVLQGLQGGVVSSVLSNFANQYPILSPLVGAVSPTASQNAPNTGYPPMLGAALAGGQPTTQGVVQPQQVPPPVLPSGP